MARKLALRGKERSWLVGAEDRERGGSARGSAAMTHARATWSLRPSSAAPSSGRYNERHQTKPASGVPLGSEQPAS
jgi:hypothetical protein